ncbi:TPA: asparaginase [Neisseria meningitidis]
MKQKIFVLYTGGTIGMTQSSEGLRPDTALVGQALAPFSNGMDFDWHVCGTLIDSSAVQLQNWCAWLDIIAAALPQYDGVLVLHGTDTLAYTANLFALALQGLVKPIVLTGSQWPYAAENSDAPRNLSTAVAAFSLKLKQTVIAFDGKLYPAVGSSKVSTETASGFDNPHFGVIAEWDETQGWYNLRIPSQDAAAVSDGLKIRYPDPQAKIAVRTLIPGFAVQELADGLGQFPAQALILQSYGHGNTPADEGFIRAVRDFARQGKLLLNISQVRQGKTAAVYAQGNAFRNSGIINGGKCNLETATALMTLAVSEGWGADEVKHELQRLGLV